jgi:hypothetical protein
VLLGKEEMVPLGMTDIQNEFGRCYEMEINVEKTNINKKLKGIIPITDYSRSGTTGESGTFQLLGGMINDARCAREINSRIVMAKLAFTRKNSFFTSKLDSDLRNKLVKCLIWSRAFYAAETWTLQKVGQKHL